MSALKSFADFLLWTPDSGVAKHLSLFFKYTASGAEQKAGNRENLTTSGFCVVLTWDAEPVNIGGYRSKGILMGGYDFKGILIGSVAEPEPTSRWATPAPTFH